MCDILSAIWDNIIGLLRMSGSLGLNLLHPGEQQDGSSGGSGDAEKLSNVSPVSCEFTWG